MTYYLNSFVALSDNILFFFYLLPAVYFLQNFLIIIIILLGIQCDDVIILDNFNI